MNAIVIEHVPVAELPAEWRARLRDAGNSLVTVRIEEEALAAPAESSITDSSLANDPLFGMWRDREDMADVNGYLRQLRAPRFNGDGAASDA